MDHNDSLPRALCETLDFQSLTEVQRRNFVGRLGYIEEVAEKIKAWPKSQAADWKGLLDDIELDLSVNMNAPDGEQTESSFVIHASWTFGLKPGDLRHALGDSILSRLECEIPSSADDFAKVYGWFADRAAALAEVLRSFYGATTAVEAISRLLALDIVLAQLLLGAYICRLNQQFPT